MAIKRMFSKELTNEDNFIEMPPSSQNLYFHLSMNADDDGFINNWKSIMRMIGAKEDDLRVLIAKQYVIPFESGVIVIRHWRLNNYLQKDRIKPTRYQDELANLMLDENNVYNLDTKCIHRIEENRIEENRIEENRIEENIYSPAKQDDIPYAEIIDYLNLRTNSNYKHTTRKTKELIKARYNEGFTLEDFKVVIDKKTYDWINDNKMKLYLRPETLFGTKFESYLNQQMKELTTNDIKDNIDWGDMFNE